MPYTSYAQVRDKIAARKDFDGNSMSGRAFPEGCGHVSRGIGTEVPPPDAVYVIWSYDTPIAWVLADGDGHLVEQKFSVTTSRHQHLASEVLTQAQWDERHQRAEVARAEVLAYREERERKRAAQAPIKEARQVQRFLREHYNVQTKVAS